MQTPRRRTFSSLSKELIQLKIGRIMQTLIFPPMIAFRENFMLGIMVEPDR